jgi:rare lipoprotein A
VRAQLRDVGPVMISAVQRDGRELYRVRVGPLTSENEADRLLAAVVQAGFSTSHVVHE